MTWLDYLILGVLGLVALAAFGRYAYLKLKPVEFESCVLKPKGFNDQPRRNKKPRR